MSRQENAFGFPMTIMDQADIDELIASQKPQIYVVTRVVDTDFTGAPQLRARVFTLPCHRCKEFCYVDPVAFNPMRGVNLVITCARCFVTHLKGRRRLS